MTDGLGRPPDRAHCRNELGAVARRASCVTHVPGLTVSAAITAPGIKSGTKVLCRMPCRAGLLARCSLPRTSPWMPGFDAVLTRLANLRRSGASWWVQARHSGGENDQVQG